MLQHMDIKHRQFQSNSYSQHEKIYFRNESKKNTLNKHISCFSDRFTGYMCFNTRTLNISNFITDDMRKYASVTKVNRTFSILYLLKLLANLNQFFSFNFPYDKRWHTQFYKFHILQIQLFLRNIQFSRPSK